MSKKHSKTQQELPPPQPAVPVPPPVPAADARPPLSRAMIWTFWGGVATALVTARVLVAALPAVPDRVIERWVMAGFAAFVGVFLYKIK